jgi:hypothetical protein
MLDRKLLKQALYASALEEWADRLSIDPPKLSKLVVIKEAISTHRHH